MGEEEDASESVEVEVGARMQWWKLSDQEGGGMQRPEFALQLGLGVCGVGLDGSRGDGGSGEGKVPLVRVTEHERGGNVCVKEVGNGECIQGLLWVPTGWGEPRCVGQRCRKRDSR